MIYFMLTNQNVFKQKKDFHNKIIIYNKEVNNLPIILIRRVFLIKIHSQEERVEKMIKLKIIWVNIVPSESQKIKLVNNKIINKKESYKAKCLPMKGCIKM